MKLYIIPGACSAVNIALRKAGIRFELARLDLETRWIGGRDSNVTAPRLPYGPM